MSSRGLHDHASVVQYYFARIQSLVVDKYHKRLLLWQDVVDRYGPGEALPTPVPTFIRRNTTTIQLWYGPTDTSWDNITAIVSAGLTGINSWSYYLWGNSFASMYAVDVLTNKTCDYTTTPATCVCNPPDAIECYDLRASDLRSLVAGGEAAMWAENVDRTNIVSTIFPQISAASERFWSNQELNDAGAAQERLLPHRCRLLERGISAAPIQPGFCSYEDQIM